MLAEGSVECCLLTLNQGSREMEDRVNLNSTTCEQAPWNKGKLVGSKPPLRPRHVWAIRRRLQLERRQRDLALFNLAIDSNLVGADVVDVSPQSNLSGNAAPVGVTLMHDFSACWRKPLTPGS